MLFGMPMEDFSFAFLGWFFWAALCCRSACRCISFSSSMFVPSIKWISFFPMVRPCRMLDESKRSSAMIKTFAFINRWISIQPWMWSSDGTRPRPTPTCSTSKWSTRFNVSMLTFNRFESKRLARITILVCVRGSIGRVSSMGIIFSRRNSVTKPCVSLISPRVSMSIPLTGRMASPRLSSANPIELPMSALRKSITMTKKKKKRPMENQEWKRVLQLRWRRLSRTCRSFVFVTPWMWPRRRCFNWRCNGNEKFFVLWTTTSVRRWSSSRRRPPRPSVIQSVNKRERKASFWSFSSPSSSFSFVRRSVSKAIDTHLWVICPSSESSVSFCRRARPSAFSLCWRSASSNPWPCWSSSSRVSVSDVPRESISERSHPFSCGLYQMFDRLWCLSSSDRRRTSSNVCSLRSRTCLLDDHSFDSFVFPLVDVDHPECLSDARPAQSHSVHTNSVLDVRCLHGDECFHPLDILLVVSGGESSTSSRPSTLSLVFTFGQRLSTSLGERLRTQALHLSADGRQSLQAIPARLSLSVLVDQSDLLSLVDSFHRYASVRRSVSSSKRHLTSLVHEISGGRLQHRTRDHVHHSRADRLREASHARGHPPISLSMFLRTKHERFQTGLDRQREPQHASP